MNRRLQHMNITFRCFQQRQQQLHSSLTLLNRFQSSSSSGSITADQFSDYNDSEQLDLSKPATVVAKSGVVVCWHPSQSFPYEHSRPIADFKVHESNIKVKSEVLLSDAVKEYRYRQYQKGPSNADLREIFYTSKHEWYPRTREKRLYDTAEPEPKYREAQWLGRISYGNALALQTRLVNQLIATKKQQIVHADQSISKCNYLLLMEHSPVYTVGIRDRLYTTDEENHLRSLGADFYRTNRGGLITFHGPGQLIVYPIIDLNNLYERDNRTTSAIGVRRFVTILEQCIIRLCNDEFGIQASTSPHTGVWIDDEKIAAIGLKVQMGITSHGLALNCNPDMSWFGHIVPCGIKDKGVTSLSLQLNRDIGVRQLIDPFCSTFERAFNCILVR